MNFHSLSSEEFLAALSVSPKGLTSQQAQEVIKKVGKNILPQ
jgi:predicted metal-dependent TIM-barrel fold hydrolase